MSSSPQKKATATVAASMVLLDRASATIDKTAGLLEEATLVTDAATSKSSSDHGKITPRFHMLFGKGWWASHHGSTIKNIMGK